MWSSLVVINIDCGHCQPSSAMVNGQGLCCNRQLLSLSSGVTLLQASSLLPRQKGRRRRPRCGQSGEVRALSSSTQPVRRGQSDGHVVVIVQSWPQEARQARQRRMQRRFGIAVAGRGRSVWSLSSLIAVGRGHARANVVIAVQGERHHH